MSKTQADYYYYQTGFSLYRIDDIMNSQVQTVLLNQSSLTPGIINKNTRAALNTLGYGFKLSSSKLSDEEISALNSVDKDKFINAFLDKQETYYKSLKNTTYEKRVAK